MCDRLIEPGPTVTHVVAKEFVTEESMWAEKENKFLVNRRWLEISFCKSCLRRTTLSGKHSSYL